MKVKLKQDFIFREEDQYKDEDPISMFFKSSEHEVVHQFTHYQWGVNDKRVYVIINEDGNTMSISAEECTVVN